MTDRQKDNEKGNGKIRKERKDGKKEENVGTRVAVTRSPIRISLQLW